MNLSPFQLFLLVKMALGIMVPFSQNPYPARVLTFRRGLNHPKNGLELVLGRQKPAVCLHHQNETNLKTYNYENGIEEF